MINKTGKTYQICKYCVIGTKSDPSMIIESNGKCERCNMYEKTVAAHWNHGRGHEKELEVLLTKIKKVGKGNNMIALLVCPVVLILPMFYIFYNEKDSK